VRLLYISLRRIRPVTYLKQAIESTYQTDFDTEKMNKIEIWLTDRVDHIKGLKSPSQQQAFLVVLAEKEGRTPEEDKKLALIVRAEKAAIRAVKARQEAATLISADRKAAKEAERKARAHRLVQQGLLFDLARMQRRSRGELMGLLLNVKLDDAQWAALKTKGDAFLAQIDEKERGTTTENS
jgi:hypothetical protein